MLYPWHLCTANNIFQYIQQLLHVTQRKLTCLKTTNRWQRPTEIDQLAHILSISGEALALLSLKTHVCRVSLISYLIVHPSPFKHE